MNILVKRAYDNLNILYNLKHGDTLNAKRGEIIILDKDDFVQVDNISDLEYSIYFTYHQLLTSNEIDKFLNTNLIEKLDISIDKIFDNKQLNGLIENDSEFKQIIDDLDEKIYELKDSYFYKSPFFNVLRNIYNRYNSMKQILIENNEYISKIMYRSNDEITADDFDFESTDEDNESDEGEEKLIAPEEEKNTETGEVNPNLIYDDNDEKLD